MTSAHPNSRRLLSVAVLLLGTTSIASAQNFERIAPQQPETPKPQQSLAAPPIQDPLPEGQRVLVPALRGLSFVNRADLIITKGVTRPGIGLADGVVMEPDAFTRLMTPYLGQPVTLDLLNEIVRKTVLFFRDHDRPLVDVVVPEHNITTGVVQLVVMEFVAGAVSAEGNEWFADRLLLPAIRTRPGDAISGESLLEDINWLNENPFRRTDLVYQRGQKVGESDIMLRTRDRLPLRVFAGFENTGSKTTSENRTSAGFNWGNAFWLGHLMSYQYTTSPEGFLHPGNRRYTAHALTYQAPLPWRDTLTVMGSYSRSLPTLGDKFRQVGESMQLSARYALRLPKLEAVTHNLEFGVDYKRSNNDLEFGGAAVSSGFTDIVQGVIGYSADRPDVWGSSNLAVNMFFSPGGLTDDNTGTAFRPSTTHTGRAYADAHYAYVRASLQRRFDLPENFSWVSKLQGQWASTNLLSSEQLGAGGVDSVRGYGEREANGDQGFLISNELQAPPILPANLLGFGDSNEKLQSFAFWDYGRVSEKRSLSDTKSAWTLSSVGAGIRYQMPYGSLRLEWGHAMPGTGQGNGNSDRLHLSMTLAY